MKKLLVVAVVLMSVSLAHGVTVYQTDFSGANPLNGWLTDGNVSVVDGASRI